MVGPHSELAICWRTGRPLEPLGELRLWLQGFGWDGAVLERDDAGRWLAVWQRERAFAAPMRPPACCIGHGGLEAAPCDPFRCWAGAVQPAGRSALTSLRRCWALA